MLIRKQFVLVIQFTTVATLVVYIGDINGMIMNIRDINVMKQMYL